MHIMNPDLDLTESLKKIKLLVLDVDGVLTNGLITVDDNGLQTRHFHVIDGQGLMCLKKSGVEVSIITRCMSPLIGKRMEMLGIKHYYQTRENKLLSLNDLLTKLDLSVEQCAYMGDDVPDLPVIKAVHLGIAVANANEFVKQHADAVTEAQGGNGAVREVCEAIMSAQGTLAEVYNGYFQ